MIPINYGVFCAACEGFIRLGVYGAEGLGKNLIDVTPGRDALRCPHCKDKWFYGRADVAHSVSPDGQDPIFPQRGPQPTGRALCQTCFGTGKKDNGPPCPSCGGTGLLRSAPRYCTDLPLRVVDHLQRDLGGHCDVISERGLGGTVGEALPVGSVVQLRFAVPTHPTMLEVRAAVRFEQRLRHGFEFVSLTAAELLAVRQFCNELAIRLATRPVG